MVQNTWSLRELARPMSKRLNFVKIAVLRGSFAKVFGFLE
ncbi:hypothetical protein J3R74_003047 [Puniceicoccus vermicola]